MSLLKKFTFLFIREIIVSLKYDYCKIHAINENKAKNNYIVTYFFLGKRQVFISDILEIWLDDTLMNKFSPLDALTIGSYVAKVNYMTTINNSNTERYDLI